MARARPRQRELTFCWVFQQNTLAKMFPPRSHRKRPRDQRLWCLGEWREGFSKFTSQNNTTQEKHHSTTYRFLNTSSVNRAWHSPSTVLLYQGSRARQTPQPNTMECKAQLLQLKLLSLQSVTNAVFTRDMFTWGKCHFTIENVTQYNRNVNLPQVNVSRVNTA